MQRATIWVLLSLMTGGLAGAIFTWYINRPKPTIVTYNVVSTSTGDTADLKLRISNEDVPVLYTDTIDLVVQSGPQVGSVVFGVKFDKEAGTPRIFGLSGQPPSNLHHMNCKSEPTGVECEMGPLTAGSNDKFRLTIAAGKHVPSEVFTTSDKVVFVRLDDYQGKENKPSIWIPISTGVLGLIFGTLFASLMINRP